MTISIDKDFFVGFFLPISAIIVSIIIYFLQKSNKRITYKIISIEPLPSFEKPINEIVNPDRKIIIQYYNGGNIHLQTEDFYWPISTKFIGGLIKNVDINVYAFKEKMSINIETHHSTSSFKPELMNPGDSVFISYVVEDFKRKIHVETKIINGKLIANKAILDYFNNILAVVIGISLGVLLNNNPDFKKLGLGINAATLIYFFPVILFLIFRLVKIIRNQYVIYYVWEI